MPLFPLKTIESINLATLSRPPSPNTAFAAPIGFSSAAIDLEAPEFGCSAAALADIWELVINDLPRTTEHARSPDGMQRTYVQRTALMGYPDVITLEFVAISDAQSSIAIYSRSQYGYSDMGANKRRVKAWLEALNQASQSPAN